MAKFKDSGATADTPAAFADTGPEVSDRSIGSIIAETRNLSADQVEKVLAHHGDLYRRHEGGFAAVDVKDGHLSTASVINAPFGYGFDMDPSGLVAAEKWEGMKE